MNEVKKTAEYRIYQKKSGRYAVQAKGKQWLHGADKEKVLLDEQLITRLRPKAPPAPEAAEETVAAE
ncbi:conserved hypothetical protein [Thiocapsa sp. KS1]|jgi:hypothetical protein|nr:hypothetical protein [Thiocapsa sp. KS1]CRI67434.1 conserved hypothetical protein [Thiocapsa sp. KS1]